MVVFVVAFSFSTEAAVVLGIALGGVASVVFAGPCGSLLLSFVGFGSTDLTWKYQNIVITR